MGAFQGLVQEVPVKDWTQVQGHHKNISQFACRRHCHQKNVSQKGGVFSEEIQYSPFSLP